MPPFAQQIKVEMLALSLVLRHPRTPWYAKIVAWVVVAYAFSPIDLIPDFIPVLGYLDDALLLPLGVWLTVRLIPAEVLTECRAQAELEMHKPVSRVGALVIVLLWVGAITLTVIVVMTVGRRLRASP